MKIGLVGDAHLGATDFSAKRRADFSQAFVNALAACEGQGAEVVCLLGDVFDSAATRRRIDAFADVLADIAPALRSLKTNGIALLAIPGNHEFGRGREAGELRALESLGLLQVLRCTEFTSGEVGIIGIPWQENPAGLPEIAQSLRRASSARRKLLLVHNYVRGAKAIPSHLWEVDHAAADGFDRGFAGHHHVYEDCGPFVAPGATETQNMLDASDKCVLIYDSVTSRVTRHALPATHRVVVLEYDTSDVTPGELRERILRDLDGIADPRETFVYVRLIGSPAVGRAPVKADVLAVLKQRQFFDCFVDPRYATKTQTATEVMRGASIDQLLRRAFKGAELEKAQRYLAVPESDGFWIEIRERILGS